MTIKSIRNRKSERGNVFFTLFGAVAIVGVLGAGIMATMRGPLSTMVNVNRRTQAEADMAIAAKLILLQAADDLDHSGDCDGDTFVEPMEFLAANPAPTGGGQIPSSIGSSKVDAWGTPYGYCAWDPGDIIDDVGNLTADPDACDNDGDTNYNRLPGTDDTSDDYMVIAIVSAGADQEFETTCAGGANPGISKTGGSDDFWVTHTYATAIAATGGLWSLKPNDPGVAEIKKDIEAQGADFKGDVSITPTVANPTPTFDLAQAMVKFPTDDTPGLGDADCIAGNDLLLRINDDTDPPSLEICDGGATPAAWESVAAGATGVSLWQQHATDLEKIYYNVLNGRVGIGNGNPTQPLDVTGNARVSGNMMLEGGSSLIWNGATSDPSITESGNGLNVVAGTGGFDITGDVTITGSGADNTTNALVVSNSTPTSIFVVENDGDVGIGVADPSDKLDVSGSVNVSDGYKIDGNTVVKSDSTIANTILIGTDAGSAVTTGDYNTILGAGAGETLVSGKNNILIGAHDVTAIDVPLLDTDNYLNIGNLIFGDLANGRVGIGTDTLNNALEVAGNIDASGNIEGTDIHATQDITAARDITATRNISGVDITASGTVHADVYELDGITQDFSDIPDCDGSNDKIIWTAGTGWDCGTDGGSGSGGGGQNLEEVLTVGNDADGLTAIDLGGIAIGSSTLTDGSGGGSGEELVLDVTGAAGADFYCDSAGENCFTASTIASGGTSKLNTITAADGNNSINSAAWNQIWNWQLSGAETAFIFGENVASSGGTIGASGNQFILKAETLATSTATPLVVTNLGTANSFRVNDETGDADATPFVIAADGKVGIGAPTPASILDVAGNGTNTDFRISRIGNAAAYLSISSTGGAHGSSNFTANGTSVFSLQPTGVAMGTYAGGATAVPAGSVIIGSEVGINDSTPDDGSGGGGQNLNLDVNGATGSAYFCDENGLNCFTAASVAGTGLWERAGTVIRTRNPAVYATDDFVFGAAQLDDIVGTDDDNRIFYDKSKGAFRAGAALSTQWDSASIGNYSAALGINTVASGHYSTALGASTTASGHVSTTMGTGNYASGDYSTTFGVHASVGDSVVADGSGNASVAFGLIDSGVTITVPPKITGIQSMGIFMGDQDGVEVDASNLMALLGGRFVIDPDTTSATNVNVSTGVQQLELDVEGDIGAINYCDQAGNNCFTPASVTTNRALSAITAAAAGNSINNADYAQVWNWNLTTADKDAFTFTENTAATATGHSSILKASTLATSTAAPLMVTNLGDGNSFVVNDETGDADTTPFLIEADGDVGIGTATPATKLHVMGTSPQVQIGDNATAGGLRFLAGTGTNKQLTMAYDALDRFVLTPGVANQGYYIGPVAGASNFSYVATNINTAGPANQGFRVMVNGTSMFNLDATTGEIGMGDAAPDDGSGSGGQNLRVDVEGPLGASYYCDQNGLNCFTPASVTSNRALSAITAATADNSINNGDWNQVWNWQLAGAETAFTFGENTASSGGTIGASGNQFVLKASTLATSTATPFIVTNLGTANSFRVNDATGDADTTPFVVDEAGEVGIGTATPGVQLQIHQPTGSFPKMRLTAADVTTAVTSGSASVGDVSATNTIGQIRNRMDGSGVQTGGMLIQGFTGSGVNNYYPLHLLGMHGGTAPTTAAVTIGGQKWSGTNNRSALDGTTPILDIENNYATAGTGGLVMRVMGDGKVGIGTTTPDALLDVSGTDAEMHLQADGEAGMYVTNASASANQNAEITARRSRGTLAAPTIVQDDDAIMGLWTDAYDGNTWETPALIQTYIDGTPGDEDMPGRIEFQTQPDGAGGNPEGTTPEMVIKNDGAVGIGLADPASRFVVAAPSTEVIGAGAVITANACGTVKRVSATANRTTDTTDTFTTPTASYGGCCMDVVNVDTVDTITLDNNANFITGPGTDLSLGPGKAVRVCSDGTSWYQAASITSVASGGNIPLSGLTAAIADNSINSGDWNQVWNWQLAGAETGLIVGENTASAGGTIGASGNQFLMKASTLATSTATPFIVTNLGTANSFRVNDETGDADATPFIIQDDGDVGIGTASPTGRLHVVSSTNFGDAIRVEGDHEFSLSLRGASNTAALNPILRFYRSRGTTAAPAIVADGDTLSENYSLGYDGNTNEMATYIATLVDGTPGDEDMPGRIEFHTNPDGGGSTLEGTTPEMVIKSDGNVGIGLSTPTTALHVDGSATIQNGTLFLPVGTIPPDLSMAFTGDTDTGFYNAGDGTFYFVSNGTALFQIHSDRLRLNSATAQIEAGFGTAANPTYSFDSDDDNGMYHPAADSLGFSTAGTERIHITSTGDVGIGLSNPAPRFVVAAPSTEVVAAAAVITADACGTVKRLSATANRTTNTTDTFTAPTASYAGCCMDVVNVDTVDTITLDNNANFITGPGTDLAVGPGKAVRVCSDGTSWYQASTVTSAAATLLAIDDLTDAFTDYAVENNLIMGRAGAVALTAGAQRNVFIGQDAGATAVNSTATTDSNTAVGYVALQSLTSGDQNTAIGRNAMQNSADASWNTAVGNQALQQNTEGDGNTAIGSIALFSNVANRESTAIGYGAMFYADDTATGAVTYNTAVGAYALQGSATAADNTGKNNTAIGHSALTSNTIGNSNTAVGAEALTSNDEGVNNTAVGRSALHYSVGSSNAAFGHVALGDNNNGSQNTALGAGALASSQTGSDNTAVGYNAGGSITTGSSNILIGSGISTPANNTSSHLNIGGTLFGDLANDNVRIGGSGAVAAGPLVAIAPASEVIAGAAVITANACGSVKQISAGGNVTTDTTDTFTTPTAAYNGCCMDVVNVDAVDTITLDTNARFLTGPGTDLALQPGKAVRVCSDGTSWYQAASVTSVASGGNIPLSGLTAAIAANSINNADYAQTWNWQLTTADKDAFTFTENTASTATGHSSILKAATLASSTATPLRVTNLGDGDSLVVNDETGDADTTPFIIKADGKVGVGTASPSQQLEVYGTNAYISLLSNGEGAVTSTAASANWWDNGGFNAARSRGTIASPTAVQSGDSVLTMWGTAYDGNTWETPALMQYFVDGTPGDGDMPGRIEFQTQADGAAVNPEATTPELVIKNNGYVGLSVAAPSALLHVNNNGAGDSFRVDDVNSDATPFVIDTTGEVGIGIAAPDDLLDIGAEAEEGISMQVSTSSHANHNPFLQFMRSRGTMAAPTAVQNNDMLLDFIVWAHDGTDWISGAMITAAVDGTPGTNDMPTRLEFNVQPDGSGTWMGDGASTPELVIKNDGAVGIGIASPASRFVVAAPTTEVVAAAAVITANACGTVKRLSATANRTTDTTDTFTAPTASYAGCCMDVVNVDTVDTITLDQNAKFFTGPGTDLALGPGKGVRVCSDGTSWYQAGGVSSATGSSSALSAITAATGANSINSGDNAQTWNWQLTTADKDAFTFTENAASTATGHSSILKAATLATSTATPLMITNLGAANSLVINDVTGDNDTTPFVVDESGNVGIGTNDPRGSLHVWNSAADIVLSDTDATIDAVNPAWRIRSDADLGSGTGGFAIMNSPDHSAYADRLVVDATGNVGIGISTPGARLDVGATNEPDIRFYDTDWSGQIGRIYAIEEGPGWEDTRLTLQSINAIGGYIDTISLKEGLVGIGTNAPDSDALLDVRGAIFVDGNNNTGIGDIFIGGGGWPYAIGVGWEGQDSSLRLNPVGTAGGTGDFRNLWIYDGKTNLIAQFEGSTKRFATGGSDSTPDAMLEVIKDAASPLFMLSSAAANNGDLMIVDTNGNVGIGTASPTDLLHVAKNQNGSTAIRLSNATAGASAEAQYEVVTDAGNLYMGMNSSTYSSNPGDTYLINQANTDMRFATNNTYRMIIEAGGDVGIGNTSPASLFVVGSPTAEVVGAAAVITANSCGTVKQISATANRTTNTTDTFTTPTASYNGCCMDVVNVDTVDTITLDQNGNFFTGAGTDIALGPGQGVRVCSDGTDWYQAGGVSSATGSSSALSAITAATGANSINSGDNAQTWNWQLTTADKDAFTFTENAASTATGHSSILKAATLATSTATPLMITNLGAANSLVINDETGDNDTSPFIVKADGKVGIGITAPETEMHILNPSSFTTLTIGNPSVIGNNASDGYIKLYGENIGTVYTGTISMQSMNLFLNAPNSVTTQARSTVIRGTTAGNAVLDTLILMAEDTDSAASNGIGASIVFNLENSVNGTYRDAAKIEGVFDDVDDNSKDGSLRFYTMGPNAASGTTTTTERVRINSSGNVGIGTVSPADNLHIYSTANVGGSGLTVDNQGASNAQQSWVNLMTVGDGTKVLPHAATKGWSLFARSNAYATAAEQNDLGFAYWSGAGWISPLWLDSATGNVGVGLTSPASKFVVASPTAEVIGAAATITANSCGTVKQISATANRTTNTTDTFTTPTASYAGCCMDVVNVDTVDTITLDQNGNFFTGPGTDIALGPGQGVRVCSDGTDWYQAGGVSSATAGGGGTIDGLTDAYADYTTLNNIIMGRTSAAALTAGAQYNLFIGENAGATSANSTAATDWNVALGHYALPALTSGHYNTALGALTLQANTTGSDNVAIGTLALNTNVTKIQSTAVGYRAMEFADSAAGGAATNNTAVGAFALQGSATAANNTGVGNTAIGHGSLMGNTSGTGNSALGYATLTNNTTGNNNIAIGYQALQANTSGSTNVAIGDGTMNTNTTRAYNTAVGYRAMLYASNSGGGEWSGNTALGAHALQGSSTAANNSGQYNTAVGYSALTAYTSGTNNTAMGLNALSAVTTGSNNTGIGFAAGDTLTTGTDNILIGYSSDTPANNTTYHLNIGDAIFGDLQNDRVRIGGSGVVSVGPLVATAPATETVAAAAIITANACGTVKRIDATANRTTNTTDTFTTPTAAHGGCCMDVVNIDTVDTITLDQNGNFFTGTGANVALAPGAGVRVCSDGTDWYQASAVSSTAAGTTALSGVIAAAADATINNGANNIVWNWQLSGAEIGHTFGENTASAGGSADQYILAAKTLASSTATPFMITNLGAAASFRVNDETGDADTSPFIIAADGKVGIGTQSPSQLLEVYGTTANISLLSEGEGAVTSSAAASNWWENGGFNASRSRGTIASPTVVQSGDSVLTMWGTAYDGNSWETPALIQYFVDGTPGNGDMPGRIEFQTQADGAAVNPEATTPEMVIKNNGYVGIGIAAPTQKLQVASDGENGIGVRVAGTSGGWNPFNISERSRGTLASPTIVQSGDVLFEWLMRGYDGGAYEDAAYIGVYVDGTPGASDMPGRIEFNTQPDGSGAWMGDGATTPELVIKNTGYVGIAMANPSVALDVTGDIEYTGTIADVSDIRLKKDIHPLTDRGSMLEKLNRINTYSFTMKQEKTGRVEFGVMAQELEKIFPELVTTAKDEMGTKSVNYVGMIAPMIEAGKELEAQNKAMKAEIDTLKAQQDEMKQAMNDIAEDMKGLKVHTGYGIGKAEMSLLMILAALGTLGAVGLARRRFGQPRQ